MRMSNRVGIATFPSVVIVDTSPPGGFPLLNKGLPSPVDAFLRHAEEMTPKELKNFRSKKNTLLLVSKAFGRDAQLLHNKNDNSRKKHLKKRCLECKKTEFLKHIVLTKDGTEFSFCSPDCVRNYCMGMTEDQDSDEYILSEYRSEYMGTTVNVTGDRSNFVRNTIQSNRLGGYDPTQY